MQKGMCLHDMQQTLQECRTHSCDACAVSVLWLPLRAYTFLIRSGGSQVSASPLAESSLLLLLALLHHAPASEDGRANPFRQAFASMQVKHATPNRKQAEPCINCECYCALLSAVITCPVSAEALSWLSA